MALPGGPAGAGDVWQSKALGERELSDWPYQCQYQDRETLTCAVPLLGFDDARLTGLSGLRLDGDDHLVIILARTTLHEISIL